MMIDLSLLHSQNLSEIILKEDYQIPKSYYEQSDILSLSKVSVDGIIEFDGVDDFFRGVISGKMILQDSISLEEVDYPFQIEYDDKIEENCKNGENTLDIFQFLWENIVLEVPLRFTRVRDLSKFHGDGWKLISEEDFKKSNNPFLDLLNNYDKE